MHATLLHNPGAGGGEPSADELATMLRRAGLSLEYYSANDADAGLVPRRTPDLVIVAGGDGTVGKTVPLLLKIGRPFTILPLGTANNIARSFEIGCDLEVLLAGLRDAAACPLDVGTVRGPWGCRHFIEGIGLGALARAARNVGDDPGQDKFELGREALRDKVADAVAHELRIGIDGEETTEKLLLFEAMNIGRIGPGLRLGLAAKCGDGVLDIVTVPAGQEEAFLDWLDAPDAMPPPVTLRHGRALTIAWNGEPLHIDDQFPLAPDRPCLIEAELQAGALTVLVPAAPVATAPA